MGQEVATIGIHTLTKNQANTLLAYHARQITNYIELPPYSLSPSATDILEQERTNDNAIREHIQQIVAISAIHYRPSE